MADQFSATMTPLHRVFTREFEFHDTSTITVEGVCGKFERTGRPTEHYGLVDVIISTGVTISFRISPEIALELSNSLAAAVQAVAAPKGPAV